MRTREIVILAVLAVLAGGIIALSMFTSAPETAETVPEEPERLTGQSQPVVHVVKRGETLGEISQQYYGTSRRWQDIFEANRDILDSPESLKPEMVLMIPRLREAMPSDIY